MNVVLYHGSDHIIKAPSLDLAKPNNDFGKGFYCTQDIKLAAEWACKKNTDGFVNSYSIDTSGLSELNLFLPTYNVLHWIALLLANRVFDTTSEIASTGRNFILENYLLNLRGYDIVQSYRADDSYFGYAQSFLNNTISVRQLNKAMRLGNLGKQIVLVSEKSLAKLVFNNGEKVSPQDYYKPFLSRDLKAREDYKALASEAMSDDDIYLIDIIRGARINDTRLQ